MESNIKHFHECGNKNAGMTIDEVVEECKLFYFAGQETTAVLLTWTMVVLSMHPLWQARAREEVLQVLGKDKPEFDALSHLKIVSALLLHESAFFLLNADPKQLLWQVTMILYEVLRLYPPLVFIQRRTYKTVEIGNIAYPPGTLLALPIIFIHHDPVLWGEDASEFKPERFAEGIAKTARDQIAFFPFGGGPRVCIGQNFALLEAKMGLCMILQRFWFELSPSYAHAPRTILIDLEFKIPHLEVSDGDVALELVHDLVGALEATVEPLKFLIGDHNPHFLLDDIAPLLPGFFCLLSSQLRSHQLIGVGQQLLLELPPLLDNVAQLLVGILQLMVEGLNLSLILHDTFSGHVLNYSCLITGLLRPCLSFIDMMEGQSQL
ncbi:hypothetical protein B296_00000166 [Ensete ventricosum]|uniref:Cytochrome P450 n=1 Tax=Ensete ventricosum TaxID=4639 RepID=A0A427AK84_ENSVE|nr:hypothetical protein B296_00000166 [Ensete ventricosum]